MTEEKTGPRHNHAQDTSEAAPAALGNQPGARRVDARGMLRQLGFKPNTPFTPPLEPPARAGRSGIEHPVSRDDPASAAPRALDEGNSEFFDRVLRKIQQEGLEALLKPREGGREI